jgi:exonuclease SbcC
MIIKSIHLQNYRRYTDQLVEFPNGLIGIVGKNGVGKSTLIEAIGWCLYGNNAARTNKDEIKKTSANPREDCKVILEMIIGDDTFKIERELRGTNSTGMARLFVNGNSSAHVSGSGEVSDYISRRTGMDHVAFFTSVFAKQKELNALSDLQPGKRKETIMRLLRVDTVDDVITKIRSDTRGSRDKIDFVKPTLKNIDSLIEQSDNLEEEKNTKLAEIENINQEEQNLKKLIILEKKKFQTEENKYRQYVKIDSTIQKLSGNKTGKISSKKTNESDLSQAKRSSEELEKIEPQLTQYDKVRKEKESLDKQHIQFVNKNNLEIQMKDVVSLIGKHRSEIAKFKSQLLLYKDLDKSIRESQKTLKSLRRKKDTFESLVSRFQEKIKGLESQKKKVDQEFSKIKNLGKKTPCPTCKRPIGEHLTDLTSHFQGEISSFTEQIKDTDSKKSNSLSKLKEIIVKITAIEKIQEELTSKKTARARLDVGLKNANKNLGRCDKQVKSFSIKLKQFAGVTYNESRHQKIKTEFIMLTKIRERSIELRRDVTRIPILESRISKLEKSISDLEGQIEDKNGILKKIGFDKSKYDSTKKSLELTNEQHNQKKIEITEKNGILNQIISNIQQIKQDIKEEEQKKMMIQAEEEKIASRSNLDKIMNDFKSDLISRIRPMLSSRASELFREITNGRYPGLELDEDYNIKIEVEGTSFGSNRFSGGEEDLANLCLRIAISQELSERAGGSRTSFIALDEIFGSQDEERKGNILKALSELSNQFKQILVITHIEDIKESLPYVLNIKENANDEVKIELEGIPVA